MADSQVIRVGEKKGRWTVLADLGCDDTKHRYFACQCECGEQKKVRSDQLESGSDPGCRSCKQFAKHRMCNTPTYDTWAAMKSRCTNPLTDQWPKYGARGITVCDRWMNSFEAFLEDMGPRPDGTTIDRFPNKDGNYEPGNCRWATIDEQANNRVDNVVIDVDGHSLTLSQWSKLSGVRASTIYSRYRRFLSSGPSDKVGSVRDCVFATAGTNGPKCGIAASRSIAGLPPKDGMLTEAQVRDIRTRHRNGESLGSIGRSLGRLPASISKIVKGLTYRGVGELTEKDNGHHGI